MSIGGQRARSPERVNESRRLGYAMKVKTIAVIPLVVATAFSTLVAQQPREAQQGPQSFRFRTGVELINVTATVTDGSGRFVSGLRKEDFRVYEDDQLQEITHFNSERVPVSLGHRARHERQHGRREDGWPRATALNRFLLELLGPEDEVFLYRFDTNRRSSFRGGRPTARGCSRELGRLSPARRHRDVRRGGRGDPAGAERHAPQEGAGHHLGRQRHEQPHRSIRD